MGRKRLNLSVDTETYVRVESMATRLGFRSACHFGSAVLKMITDPATRDEIRRIESEAEGAFMDFEDFETLARWEEDHGNPYMINTRR